MLRELLPDVFIWARPSAPHGYDFNGYLICHPDGNICIDPVPLDDEELTALARLGVAHIILTNRNHTRAAEQLRARTGAPIAIHPHDAGHARAQGTTIDAALGPGDRIGPLVVVGVPGKSPGEIALYWRERRLLVVGDAVVGNPPGRLALLREQVMDDPPRLRTSLRGLVGLEVTALLVCDGAPVLEDAEARLRELIESFSS